MICFLWLVLVVALPVPLVVPVRGEVPAARILMLAAIALAEMVVETPRGAAPMLAAFLLVQALLAMAVLWLAARAAGALLRFLPPAARTAAALGIAALLVLAAATGEIYRDPYRASTLRTGLFGVYE